jgi:hypothetical protein
MTGHSADPGDVVPLGTAVSHTSATLSAASARFQLGSTLAVAAADASCLASTCIGSAAAAPAWQHEVHHGGAAGGSLG